MYERFLEVKANIEALQDELRKLEIDIYNEHQMKLNSVDEGTCNFDCGNFKVKIVKKMNWAIDQNKAQEVVDICRVKYELDKTKYNLLSYEEKMKYADAITSKPAKPSFSVERV